MKRSMIVSCLVLIGSFAFGQKHIYRDPSYSTRNYKQSNKVAVARQMKFEQTVQLTPVVTWSTAEHKHRYNNAGLVVQGSLKTIKVNSSRRGSKHPLSL